MASQVDANEAASDEKIRYVNHRVESWQVYWNDYYGKCIVLYFAYWAQNDKAQSAMPSKL
jgi:hypothetical protein